MRNDSPETLVCQRQRLGKIPTGEVKIDDFQVSTDIATSQQRCKIQTYLL